MVRAGLAIAATCLLAAGCGGGYDPDMPKIERDLAQKIQDQEDIEVTVDCPDSIDWKPGSDFHCTADGITVIKPARITVSMENDQGEYTWTVDGN